MDSARNLLSGTTPTVNGNEVEVDDALCNSLCNSLSLSLFPSCCSVSQVLFFWELDLDTDFFRVELWWTVVPLLFFLRGATEGGLPRLEIVNHI